MWKSGTSAKSALVGTIVLCVLGILAGPARAVSFLPVQDLRYVASSMAICLDDLSFDCTFSDDRVDADPASVDFSAMASTLRTQATQDSAIGPQLVTGTGSAGSYDGGPIPSGYVDGLLGDANSYFYFRFELTDPAMIVLDATLRSDGYGEGSVQLHATDPTTPLFTGYGAQGADQDYHFEDVLAAGIYGLVAQADYYHDGLPRTSSYSFSLAILPEPDSGTLVAVALVTSLARGRRRAA